MLLSAFCRLEYPQAFRALWKRWSWQHSLHPRRTSLFLRGWHWTERPGKKAQSSCPQMAVFPPGWDFKRETSLQSPSWGGGCGSTSLLQANFRLQLQGGACLRSAPGVVPCSPPPFPAVSIMGAKCLCWPFMNREDRSCLQQDLLLFLGHAFVSLLL